MRRVAVTVLIALSFVWFGACRSCMAQQIIGRPMLPLSLGCGTFTAQTAVWNITQTVAKSGGLTGLADGKQVTLSFWLKKLDATSNTRAVIVTSNGGAGVTFQVNIQVQAVTGSFSDTSAGTAFSFQTTKLVGTNTWTHILMAVDLTSTLTRHIYFNGIEDLAVAWTTYNNINMDLTPTSSVNIGINHLGNNIMSGAMAEFWMDDVYLNDTSKFICTSSGTHPISLGSTGNLPTGSAPACYFSLNGSGNSWATDSSGNGNTMTVTGTLSSTTSP